MFGRRKARKSEGELGPAGAPRLDYPAPAWPQEAAPVEETPAAPVGEDFLPADLRLDLSTKRFLVWRRPLVLESEVRSCPQCAAYRDWAILAVEGQIWLRCPAKHVTPEPRLSLEWFNRNAGPSSSTYGSLDEGLDDFGL